MDPKPHPSQGQLFELILYCGDSIPRSESIEQKSGAPLYSLWLPLPQPKGGTNYPGSMIQANTPSGRRKDSQGEKDTSQGEKEVSQGEKASQEAYSKQGPMSQAKKGGGHPNTGLDGPV